ncbi:MAG: hypothetical protein IJ192_01960 [Clostridia bacterium]|nr:hypothetical protein [Clostridia bacterium]
MAVFSKPVHVTFEVAEDKVEDFLKVSKESMLDKALTRAKKCREIAEKNKRKKEKDK